MAEGVLVAFRGSSRGILERLRHVRALGGVPLVGDDRWPDEQWDAVVRCTRAEKPRPGTGWATLTSGSSGTPRIVLRTAHSWEASFGVVSELLDADDGAAVALPAPPSSSLTLFSLSHALAGGPRPLLPRGHALVAEDFRDATCFHGTPHALRTLLDAGPPPKLKAALVGGSRLDPAIRAHAEALGVRVTSYYGAAELSFVALDTGDGLRPFPGVDIRIRDGLIWVRSPYVASGYLTGEGPLRRDHDWATVGDRGELVEAATATRRATSRAALRLLGRADDAILTASATVVPEEVETALRSLPGVRDAVVFGMPQSRIGGLVAAMVEPDVGVHLTAATLGDAAAGLLAPAHRPRRWFVGEVPRLPSGKPARTEIVRRVRDGEVRPLAR